MKVIAFFDLKKGKNIEEFLEWVKRKQSRVFENIIPGLSNFKVYPIIDEDNAQDIPTILQIFDYKGSAEDWRKVLNGMKITDNRKISEVVEEWLGFCIDESTKIIYVDDFKQ